ncbi:MAG: hypothetical protein AAB545_01245 [Patescibacteria group bacterium]
MIELFLSLAIILLSLLLLNPLHLWMPSGSDMGVVVALLIVFAAFVIFIFKEKPSDERELAHRNTSGRVAFLAGAGVLVIGIAIEGLHHSVNSWLIYSLIAMVIGKIIGLYWSKTYR